jgi:broad specificity phosphatase PhoE
MNGRRLTLIRHGRVDFASRDFTKTPRGRQWDPPLGDEGRRQADLLSTELLSHEPPAALYCSPLRRCLETVAPYASAAGIDAITDEDLEEVFVGDWEGEAFEDILDSDEEVARRFHMREPLWTLSPGGERGADFRARVVTAVERILDAQPDGDITAIVHGGVINAYVMHVLGIVDRDMFFLPENTSLNIIAIGGTERRIQFINDIRHLTGPRGFPAQRTSSGDASA